MNIMLLGAAGFIGTNLIMELAKDKSNNITAVDINRDYFKHIEDMKLLNVHFVETKFNSEQNYDNLLCGQEIIYHLVSTTVPTTSNQCVTEELKANVLFSANLFEACVRQKIKKVIFISSGGTVYGKEAKCPLNEKTPTNPITSYGIQKVTIEKLLYLYNYMYGLDYRIIRLANPYGPYQRPNGVLGVITTFTYKALRGETVKVFGDGRVVRDFIYIDDAVRGILKIAEGDDKHHTFNLGSGYGTSINQVLEIIQRELGILVNVEYVESRKVDVPINYLDIERYETAYGALEPISICEGVARTAKFLKTQYDLCESTEGK